jgi:hypothetical protein
MYATVRWGKLCKNTAHLHFARYDCREVQGSAGERVGVKYAIPRLFSHRVRETRTRRRGSLL